MANSTFPITISTKAPGTSNAKILNAIRSGRVPYTMGNRYWWKCRVQAGDFTGEADGDQTLDLNVLYPTGAFPANVLRLPGTFVRIDTGIGGGTITDADIEVGDAGDPNGLLTVTPAFEGTDEGLFSTPAAAENDDGRVETAFAPTLRILTTGDETDDIDAMDVTVFIPFMPLPA